MKQLLMISTALKITEWWHKTLPNYTRALRASGRILPFLQTLQMTFQQRSWAMISRSWVLAASIIADILPQFLLFITIYSLAISFFSCSISSTVRGDCGSPVSESVYFLDSPVCACFFCCCCFFFLFLFLFLFLFSSFPFCDPSDLSCENSAFVSSSRIRCMQVRKYLQ